MWLGICLTGRFLGDPCSTLSGIAFIQRVSPVETGASAETKKRESAPKINRQQSIRYLEKQLSQTQPSERTYSRQTAHFASLSLTRSLDHVAFLTRASRRPMSWHVICANFSLLSSPLLSQLRNLGRWPEARLPNCSQYPALRNVIKGFFAMR